MTRLFKTVVLASAAAALSMGAAPGKTALAAGDFYAGKTITIIAGFRPGGGIDGNARLIARHFGKFIPGTPKMLVKNIPGAAGGVAANHMYNKAKPNGLTVAVPGRGWPLTKLLGDPGVRFEPLKFTFLGSPGVDNGFLWVHSSLGIKNLDQLRKSKKKVVLAAYSKSGYQLNVPLVLAKHGWPLKPLAGYRGTSKTLLAIERKEVDGIWLPWGSIQSARRDMLDDKVVIPLMQTHKIAPGIPWLMDFIPDADKALINLMIAQVGFGVPFIAPPGVPADRAKLLRDGFMKMAGDSAFQADAKKRGIPTGAAHSGAKIKAMVATALATDPAVVARFKKMIPRRKRGGKKKKK